LLDNHRMLQRSRSDNFSLLRQLVRERAAKLSQME
jgi:hypothetical protein